MLNLCSTIVLCRRPAIVRVPLSHVACPIGTAVMITAAYYFICFLLRLSVIKFPRDNRTQDLHGYCYYFLLFLLLL